MSDVTQMEAIAVPPMAHEAKVLRLAETALSRPRGIGEGMGGEVPDPL